MASQVSSDQPHGLWEVSPHLALKGKQSELSLPKNLTQVHTHIFQVSRKAHDSPVTQDTPSFWQPTLCLRTHRPGH